MQLIDCRAPVDAVLIRVKEGSVRAQTVRSRILQRKFYILADFAKKSAIEVVFVRAEDGGGQLRNVGGTVG